MIVEVGKDEGSAGVHAFVHRTVQRSVPVLVVGADTDVEFVVSALRHQAADDPPTVHNITLYRPAAGPHDKYLFGGSRMALVLNGTITFKVCIPPSIPAVVHPIPSRTLKAFLTSGIALSSGIIPQGSVTCAVIRNCEYNSLPLLTSPITPSQLPRVVTVLDTSLYHALPLELAWWWLFRSGVETGRWVAVVSNKANLVGALAVRAGTGLNLWWGVPEVDAEDTKDLEPYVEQLKTQVRVADGLPPVRWGRMFPCM